MKNEGIKLNEYPWVVSIKEKVYDDRGNFLTNAYHTGTLVSKEYVVTAASIFDKKKNKENFEALVAAKRFADSDVQDTYPDHRWSPIAKIQIHPHYNSRQYISRYNVMYDVAMLKLKIRDDF